MQPKLWAKEGSEVKLPIWFSTTKSWESTSSRRRLKKCDTVLETLDNSYNFGLELVPIRVQGEELRGSKVPGQFWDSNLGVPGKGAIWM
jgi:hypothetical protein